MPAFKAFYLLPLTTYRTPLRSDTLWGKLAWAIRLLYGEKELEKLIESYESGGPEAFYISSAFPFGIKEKTEELLHFLPRPMLPPPRTEDRQGDFLSQKIAMRQKKNLAKIAHYDLEQWENVAKAGELTSTDSAVFQAPRQRTAHMTHVTIDRATGSTLSLNNGGQLFHSPEKFLKPDKKAGVDRTGLFFLAQGDTTKVETALRYLRHIGLGGDRTTGKGTFELYKIADFELKSPATPNALMTLSLFHPKAEERLDLEKITEQNERYLNYKLVRRQGRMSPEFMVSSRYQKDIIPYFEEGSTFPISAFKNHLTAGFNPPAMKDLPENPARQYGHALFVPINIK